MILSGEKRNYEREERKKKKKGKYAKNHIAIIKKE